MKLRIALTLLLLGGCAAGPVPASSEPSSLSTFPERNVKVTSSRLPNGDVESVLEVDGEVAAQAWYIQGESRWDYVIFGSTPDTKRKGAVQSESFAEPLLEGARYNELSARLYERWKAFVRREEVGADEYDDPGCNFFDIVPGPWFQGNSHCVQNCCAFHDNCYAQTGCTADSFGDRSNAACNHCNDAVMGCVGACISDTAFPPERRSMKDSSTFEGMVFNPCGPNQHRCYDSDCNNGPGAFYCKADCYTEPSPCEEAKAGQAGLTWCVDPGGCRDANGRKAYPALNCQTALSSCSCPTLSGSDVNVHTRCLDLSCDAGKQGFCVATTTNCGQTGNVLASPCCGDRGQTCCREGPSCTNTNVNICQSGTCVECGATNMPCCQPGNACRAGFICDGAANRCTACGQPGLPCCVGNGCNGVCQNGQCKTPPPLPAQWTVDVAAYCGGNLVVRNSGGTTGSVSITFSGQDCIGIIYQNQLIGSCASVPPGSSCTVATIGGLLASQQYFLNGTAIAGSRGQCSFGCNFNVPGFFPL